MLPPLFHAPAMVSLLHQSGTWSTACSGKGAAAHAGTRSGGGDDGRRWFLRGQPEAARAWVNEQLYLAYLSVFSGAATTQDAEGHLTALAEAALTLVAETVTGGGADHFPLCVPAGQLGMNAMAPHSDLDLIFVVEEGWSLEEANAVAARFNTAFNAQMREGRVWELDTRLRPSGRSGPPTISLASFESHHLQGAKTWEHLAQVPMRLSGPRTCRSGCAGARRHPAPPVTRIS